MALSSAGVLSQNAAVSDLAKPEFTSTHEGARRMRRSRAWQVVGMIPWALGLGLIAGAIITRTPALLAPLLHTTILGAVAFFGLRKWNPSSTWRTGRVIASAEGIRFDGELVVARERIKDALITPYKGQTAVRISLKGVSAPEYIAVKEVPEGRRMLRALGLDASQSVARLKGLSPFFQWPTWKAVLASTAPLAAFFGIMASAVSLFGKQAAPYAVATLPILVGALLVPILNPTKVDVGADGILTTWFGRKRFFPYAGLEVVEPYEESKGGKVYIGVELGLRSGETVRILIGQKRWADESQALMLERISEAIETYKSGMSASDASILGRNGRAPADWITALRQLGAGSNADMRTAPVAIDRLWTLVEDASATALSRVSAAIALGPHIDERERKRIRIAAESTASPKLRVALEKASASDSDEEELAEVLSEMEQEAAASSAG